jgi:hypothetical protein
MRSHSATPRINGCEQMFERALGCRCLRCNAWTTTMTKRSGSHKRTNVIGKSELTNETDLEKERI